MASTTSIIPLETPLTRSIKFWILLIFQIPSIFCSLFVLYHMFASRNLRQTLANHVIISILIVSLCTVTIDLSMTLHYLREGMVRPRTPSYCLFWVFIDYFLYTNGTFLMAWASIERHILVFSAQRLRSARQILFGHSIPLVICFIYPFLFYILMIFAFPCIEEFDFERAHCGSPCFKRISFAANCFDVIAHNVLPCLVVVVSSLLLLIRVIRQKRRIHQQSFPWRRHHRMVVQLLSIASLYIVMSTPPFLTLFIQNCCLKTFALAEQTLYFFYLYYFLALLLPFVCLRSLGNLRGKFICLLQTIGCQYWMISTRVGVIGSLDYRTNSFRRSSILPDR